MYFKFSIVLSAALLLSLSLELSGVTRSGHMLIRRSSVPNDGATVKESPREMRMQFTEGVELAFSQITVKSAKGEVVSQGNCANWRGRHGGDRLEAASAGKL